MAAQAGLWLAWSETPEHTFCRVVAHLFLYLACYAVLSLNIFGPRHDKTNKIAVRPAKTQISLGIRPVWSESSLCAQWVAKDPPFLQTDSKVSDQTGRMPRLIWVFDGRTLIWLVLSCRGSFFLFVLVSGVGCRLWLWHFLDFAVNFLLGCRVMFPSLTLEMKFYFRLTETGMLCNCVYYPVPLIL